MCDTFIFLKEADVMDLEYTVTDNCFFNVRDVLKNEFHVSSRLFVKLKNSGQIFLNR